MAHVRAFTFNGGVPALIVCDNLKAGVISPHRYEPEANRTYEDLAEHYGCAILPARVRKPKDKAKVEKAVQDVERRILAPLAPRRRRFFSLHELNEAIRWHLVRYNERPFQTPECSRRSLFEQLDKPAFAAAAGQRPYEYAYVRNRRGSTWTTMWPWAAITTALIYQLLNQTHDIRFTDTAVECFHIAQTCGHSGCVCRDQGASFATKTRPHAEESPGLRGMDAGTACALGRQDRSANGF